MRRVPALLAGLLLAAGVTPALARASDQARSGTSHPHGRTARLVARAERSPYLWATVNQCSNGDPGGTLGVRGEMPALGIPATLTMRIQLEYDASTQLGFVTLPGATATRTIALGRYTDEAHQAGASFPFAADPGLVRASVTFTWSRGARTLGTVTRTTTAGHPQAAFGVPAHHSAATCRLS